MHWGCAEKLVRIVKCDSVLMIELDCHILPCDDKNFGDCDNLVNTR